MRASVSQSVLFASEPVASPAAEPASRALPRARRRWCWCWSRRSSCCAWARCPSLGPDEPRYARVAVEMQRAHEWVTPTLQGEPWLEKPPLYYWLAGLAYRTLGETEVAARLPSVLAAAAGGLRHGPRGRAAVRERRRPARRLRAGPLAPALRLRPRRQHGHAARRLRHGRAGPARAARCWASLDAWPSRSRASSSAWRCWQRVRSACCSPAS